MTIRVLIADDHGVVADGLKFIVEARIQREQDRGQRERLDHVVARIGHESCRLLEEDAR